MKKNITLNKNKIMRRIKHNKKNTRRRKFYMKKGGNDDEDIPMQDIVSPTSDITSFTDIEEPLETSFPSLPPPVDEPAVITPPVDKPDDITVLPPPPVDEQDDITPPPLDDPLDIASPSQPVNENNDADDENTTTSTLNDTPALTNKKFVLVRISLPDGNIMDLQGDTSTTMEETIQELKNEGHSTSTSEKNTHALSLRLNDLEKMIEGLNIKLDTLIKKTTEDTVVPDPTTTDDIITKQPETTDLDFLAFPPITTETPTSQVEEPLPVPVDNQPEPITDDFTAFTDVDD